VLQEVVVDVLDALEDFMRPLARDEDVGVLPVEAIHVADERSP
jgi:hypothetical protein